MYNAPRADQETPEQQEILSDLAQQLATPNTSLELEPKLVDSRNVLEQVASLLDGDTEPNYPATNETAERHYLLELYFLLESIKDQFGQGSEYSGTDGGLNLLEP